MDNLFTPSFIGLLAITIILALTRPQWVFPIFLASIPYENLASIEGNSITRILGVVVLLSYLAIALTNRKPLRFDAAFWFFFMFTLLGLISIFWSADSSETLSRFITLVQLLILYFLLINQVTDFKEFDRVMTALFWGSVIFAFIGLGDLILGLSGDQSVRLASIARNANGYFIYAICMIPANYWILTVKKSKFLKMLSVFILFILLVTSLNTQSRGGLISLGVFFLVYLYLTTKKLSALLLILIVALMVLQLTPLGFEDRLLETSTDIRITGLWPAGWQAIRDRPLGGFGLGMNSRVIPRYYFQPTGPRSVHSGFLAVGIELGIIGLILYLLFVIIPAVKLFKYVRRDRKNKSVSQIKSLGIILIAVFIAYLSSWVKGGGMEYAKLLWVLVGLMSSCVSLLQSSQKDESLNDFMIADESLHQVS